MYYGDSRKNSQLNMSAGQEAYLHFHAKIEEIVLTRKFGMIMAQDGSLLCCYAVSNVLSISELNLMCASQFLGHTLAGSRTTL